jgi:biotin carboxylase
MYEKLKGKTLLVMDRTALAACAVERAKDMGVRTVVANFYKTEESPSKQVADIAIDVDISNTEAMLKIIKDYNIDGIFVGWTDSHLPFYARICAAAGLPCCGTLEQFDILSNDKNRFKEHCVKYGVPTPELFHVDINFFNALCQSVQFYASSKRSISLDEV